MFRWKIILNLLLSCNDNEAQDSFDYKKLFSDYKIEIAQGKSFDSIYYEYYIHNNFIIQDTEFPSVYNELEGCYSTLKENLIINNKIVYYWDEDILNTGYSSYLDTTNCDCNLVIVYNNDSTYQRMTMCFLKEKILSTVTYFDFEKDELQWLIEGDMPNYIPFNELSEEHKEMINKLNDSDDNVTYSKGGTLDKKEKFK